MSNTENCKLAVLTSGGDAPGLNACINAVVRTAIYNKLKVYGVKNGFEGLISGQFFKLNTLDYTYLLDNLIKNWQGKRTSLIFIVAEGDESGGAIKVAQKLEKFFPNREIRISILGYIQRGGTPTAFDRILATRLGNAAIDFLRNYTKKGMVCIQNRKIQLIPFSKVKRRNMPVAKDVIELLEIMTA